MDDSSEVEHLRQQLALLRKQSSRSGWLFRRLTSKVVHFPRDFSRRMRRSFAKRWSPAPQPTAPPCETTVQPERTSPHDPLPMPGPEESSEPKHTEPPETNPLDWLVLSPSWAPRLQQLANQVPPAGDLETRRAFLQSDAFHSLVEDAIALDPNIAAVRTDQPGYLAPWFDEAYEGIRKLEGRLPEGPIDALIVVPFGKMGGADFVAGQLSKALAKHRRCLILRTDLSDWERPDWYADGVASVDIADLLDKVPHRTKALFCLIRRIAPKAIYNVNSRLCFDMFVEFGARLARQSDLYAYYFCADYTAEGYEAGYPIWYVTDVLPHLTAGFCDTRYLRDRLVDRYQLPADMAGKLRTVYTPFNGHHDAEADPETQSIAPGDPAAPVILWAGRLDRQKRFDLVQEVARLMPDVTFHAWGKAVLDAPPDVGSLPDNLTLHAPFKSYAELPLSTCDGWLYTSAWDGLPTILIEIAGLGVPIVASAVGGVPELIDETTGWPVREADTPQSYVTALRDMLSDPAQQARRVANGRDRVRERHSDQAYQTAVDLGGALHEQG